ncbi:formylmethanofuran dehydrogenase subunit B [Candidatus Nitrosoglobus terrae]|uniref:Formylmethanofuran dehydrogenase subunit B n=1 Tax=Candidatus Nitrosoglobus terrae TaxID=1630141 RepID=A0A1Q2SJU0_9GAMM|nr:formylmethanofuran dehydrogenase subunit B [Candidatus Nitrosoglobus terrae]BAW79380.1 formylmethanofuran dehydrogenase subunit B [Candidatus Nitrosoglobus terrae]
MIRRIEDDIWDEVPNPFCGAITDELKVKIEGNRLTVLESSCPITKYALEQEIGDSTPKIQGKPVTLEAAIKQIVEILDQSHLPLLSGLATDIAGIQAILALADHYGAVVDHIASKSLLSNILAFQNSSWITTTLSEVKNRLDLLMIVGSDIEASFPQFFKRYVWNTNTLFDRDPSQRKIIYLGQLPNGQKPHQPDGYPSQIINCKLEDLPEVIAALKAQIIGNLLQAKTVASITIKELTDLANQLKQARYGVITWITEQWTFPHAELTVQVLGELIKAVNKTTRCSGLPLGGLHGEITASHVCTWQTGYPIRISFAPSYPDYDPYHYATQQLLDSGEADTLIWISAFDQRIIPPLTSIPTIVLGRSGMHLMQVPEVFIPVGTPGIDHQGHIYRADNAVIMPLYKLRDSGLPSTAEILNAILRYSL